jgi:hypothetical protein
MDRVVKYEVFKRQLTGFLVDGAPLTGIWKERQIVGPAHEAFCELFGGTIVGLGRDEFNDARQVVASGGLPAHLSWASSTFLANPLQPALGEFQGF